MDDRYFYMVLVYMFIAVVISSQLPDSFITGSVPSNNRISSIEIVGDEAGTVYSTTMTTLSTFDKIMIFLFQTWKVYGLPYIISILIELVNILCIVTIIIYVWDKFRGN